MTDKDKRRQKLLEPHTITLPGKDFQPRKADMEREFDMPYASMDTLRNAFFRPVNVERKDPEWRDDVTFRY